MAESIGQAVSRCLSDFKSLLTLSDEGWREGRVEPSRAQDELARFKVWAGNIGAHQTGRSSLEYRLRDASHIRLEVLRLLDELAELIDDARSILHGERVPWDKLPVDANDDVSDSLSADTGTEDVGKDDGGSIPATEMAQIFRNIADITNCLLRLSVAIRNPAPHDRFRASKSTDTSPYEPFDIQHVRTKFPNMDEAISERLGKAISRRRQYFKYRQSHHNKLAEGLDHDTNKTEVHQSTVASSIPTVVKQDASFDINAAVDEDGASESGASHTSYATSISTTDSLRVPPMPAEASNGPFECPFCYMVIITATTWAWKKHVFRDLRPYVCLSRDCEAADQDFGCRRLWMDHVLQYHWKLWQCPVAGCSETFDSAANSKSHVAKDHPEAFPPSQLQYAVELYERPTDMQQGIECPVCDLLLASVNHYQKHVANHQEQLALFSLPNIDIHEKRENGDGLIEDSLGSSKDKQNHDYESSGSIQSIDFETRRKETTGNATSRQGTAGVERDAIQQASPNMEDVETLSTASYYSAHKEVIRQGLFYAADVQHTSPSPEEADYSDESIHFDYESTASTMGPEQPPAWVQRLNSQTRPAETIRESQQSTKGQQSTTENMGPIQLPSANIQSAIRSAVLNATVAEQTNLTDGLISSSGLDRSKSNTDNPPSSRNAQISPLDSASGDTLEQETGSIRRHYSKMRQEVWLCSECQEATNMVVTTTLCPLCGHVRCHDCEIIEVVPLD